MTHPSLSETFRSIEQELDLRMYSHEHEIVMHLYEFGSATFDEIMVRIKASRNTTCDALRVLTAIEVARAFPDRTDRRLKRYALTPSATARLDQGYAGMAGWFGDRQPVADGARLHLTRMIGDLENVLGFSCFSPQYEIVSILFEAPGLSNKAVHSMCRSSRSHFQRLLNAFVADGRVVRDAGAHDRRVSTYRLGDRVSAALNQNFRRSHQWFEARLARDWGTGQQA